MVVSEKDGKNITLYSNDGTLNGGHIYKFDGTTVDNNKQTSNDNEKDIYFQLYFDDNISNAVEGGKSNSTIKVKTHVDFMNSKQSRRLLLELPNTKLTTPNLKT